MNLETRDARRVDHWNSFLQRHIGITRSTLSAPLYDAAARKMTQRGAGIVLLIWLHSHLHEIQ